MRAAAKVEPMKSRTLLWLSIGAGLALLFAANAHLVYVAMTSQPDCVAHLRSGDNPNAAAQFRAAKSSCKPQ
jgi:predicted dinucleotide-binding enzyme